MKNSYRIIASALLLFTLITSFPSCKDLTDVFKPSSEKKITKFYFLKTLNPVLPLDSIAGTINEEEHTITLHIDVVGIDISNLKASFDVTDLTSIGIGKKPQESGLSANDFSSILEYTVTALDGSTQTYKVNVIVPKYTGSKLISFSFQKAFNSSLPLDFVGVMDTIAKTIKFVLPYETDLTTLKASFVTSTKATVNIDLIPQQSGITANDFTNPKTIKVVSEDGNSTHEYVISIVKETYRSWVITNMADAQAFVPGDSIRNLTLTGLGVNDAVAQLVGSKTMKVVGNLILENTSVTKTESLFDVTLLPNAQLKGGFIIKNNQSLVSCRGFVGMTKIGGDLIIENCPNLALTGGAFGSLEKVGGSIRINSNKTDEAILAKLKYVGGDFDYQGHPGWGIWNMKLSYLGGSLIVKDCPLFFDFKWLANLTYFGGNVYIRLIISAGADPDHFSTLKQLKDRGIIKNTAIIDIARLNADGSYRPIDLDNM